MTARTATRLGAGFYTLWGLIHVLGAGVQLATLRSGGGAALAAMISSARPFDVSSNPVPTTAGAFMGMGAFNLLWIGGLVTWLAVTMNWKGSVTGYWLNLGIVGATDLGLLLFLLLPGTMAWTDGGIGITLFVLALGFSTLGRVLARRAGRGAPSAERLSSLAL